MSEFLSRLAELRDRYVAEERELKERIARDQERYTQIQSLRAACETLLEAHVESEEPDALILSASIRQIVLQIVTETSGIGYTPANIYEILKDTHPDLTVQQIDTALRQLSRESSAVIKYAQGHYYS